MVKTWNKIPCSRKKFNDNAVSEVVGYVILLGIVVTGLSFIIITILPIVNSSKDDAQFNSIEQAFTTADSRISKARFSTSIFQETPFQLNEGTIIVNGSDTNSYIEIYKHDEVTNTDYLISHTLLGTLKCVTDHGEVAYQDGGVWEMSPDGGSIMISPPDFDFNGETLTLPIMSITSSDSFATNAKGKVLIDIKSLDPVTIYPRDNSPNPESCINPVEPGKDIIIKIKSDYYLAWADFINERTKANATIDPSNKLVIVTLKTGSPTQSGLITSGMNSKHMETATDDAPVTKFTIHLEKRNNGKDYFLSIRPPAGTDPFLEIETDRLNGPGKENIAIAYKYTDTANHIYEAFSTTLSFDSSTEYSTIDIPLLSTDLFLVYGDEDGDGNIDSTVNPDSVTWGVSQTITDTGTFPYITNGNDAHAGDEKTLADITQHYLRLMALKHTDTGPVYSTYGTEKGNDNQHVHYDPQIQLSCSSIPRSRILSTCM